MPWEDLIAPWCGRVRSHGKICRALLGSMEALRGLEMAFYKKEKHCKSYCVSEHLLPTSAEAVLAPGRGSSWEAWGSCVFHGALLGIGSCVLAPCTPVLSSVGSSSPPAMGRMGHGQNIPHVSPNSGPLEGWWGCGSLPGTEPFLGTAPVFPCSPVDFPRDYRGHFILLTCCFVPPFLDGYYSSPREDKHH